MDEETYQQMPQQLTVREVRVRVAAKGFRVKWLVLVTTLLDAQLYTRDEIARAFGFRWHVEEYQPHYPSSASFYQLAA
jgi:hypothetical protein